LSDRPTTTPELEVALRDHLRREEAAAEPADRTTDSLWDHLRRTAVIAERLGCSEGVDPAECRLAALFHDAGKLHDGAPHGDDRPEEEHSVDVLRDFALRFDLPSSMVEEAAAAILQLCRNDPDPTPLAKVLFDADNLDKLGYLGAASFFVKRVLRGRGISPELMTEFTVELTYARHAEACMRTETGRTWARRRAPRTLAFFRSLVDELREDGLAELEIRELNHDGLEIEAVVPSACGCAGALAPEIEQNEGIKCRKIHLAWVCADCGERLEVRFCRPRLVSSDED
jgi:HD superfamily phosphodiesterase